MVERLGEVAAVIRLAADGAQFEMLGLIRRFRAVYAAADTVTWVI
jgi:hypothetical protein